MLRVFLLVTLNTWFWRPSPARNSLVRGLFSVETSQIVEPLPVFPPHVDGGSVPVRRHLHVVLDDDEQLVVPPGPGPLPGGHDPAVDLLPDQNLPPVTELEVGCDPLNKLSLKIYFSFNSFVLHISHMFASPSVNPDLQEQLPVGRSVVVGVLQGLEQPVEGPGPVVSEDDDPELGLTEPDGWNVTSPEGRHQGDKIRKIRRVAKFTK